MLNDLKWPHRLGFVFHRIMAPDSRNFLAMVESAGTVVPASAYDPAVLFILSFVAIYGRYCFQPNQCRTQTMTDKRRIEGEFGAFEMKKGLVLQGPWN